MVEQVSSLKTGVKYKDAPIGRIPVDWEVVELADICDEIYRYPTYYNLNYVDQKHGVPEIRGELIKENGELSNDLSQYRYISRETSSKFPRTIVREGDFVISVRGTLGKIGYVSDQLEHANITANLMRISPSRKRVYPLWLKQYLLSKFFQNRLNEISAATTIKTVKAPELKAIKVALPLHCEQKKIAEILITVDEAIVKTTQIIEKTKNLKKGMMKRVLSRGIGHKKFKKTEIGEIPEEWKVVYLGDIANIERGRFSYRPRNAPQFYGGDTPFIQTADIANSNGRIKNYSQTLNNLGVSISKIFPKGTILITIAANIGYTGILEFDGACPDSVIGIKPNENISAIYLHYYLSGQQKKMEVIAPQCVQKNINIQILKSWRVLLPGVEEQKQISNTMLAIDDEIERESEHKEQLESLKKGLMQVLLTGKLRVTV